MTLWLALLQLHSLLQVRNALCYPAHFPQAVAPATRPTVVRRGFIRDDKHESGDRTQDWMANFCTK